MNQLKRLPGRPRDTRLDEALLDAAAEVFLVHGYERATFSAIARRAAVSTPAIYRRWPTKADMAFAVAKRSARADAVPDTGSIRRDLGVYVRRRWREYRAPLLQRVLFPLAVKALSDRRLQQRVSALFKEYRSPSIKARVSRAIATGELRSDTDPDLLAYLLIGAFVIPALFSQDLPRPSDAQKVVDHVLDGFGSARGRPHRSGRSTRIASRGPVRDRGSRPR